MEEGDIVAISIKVLTCLSKMDYEKTGGSSNQQLIFPLKIQAMGTKEKNRISEQELRFLFVEEFIKENSNLFYSIETPTEAKYKFGKSYNDIKIDKNGQSALLDMCVFKNENKTYKRILNIEFKSKNPNIKGIGKDLLKLMHEKQNGAFIHLLKNTNINTFINKTQTGIFDKLYKSFNDRQNNWEGIDKNIHLLIISLNQKTLIHRTIIKSDLNNLEEIFFINDERFNIRNVNGNDWKTININ